MMITAHSGCDGTKPNSEEYLLYAFASGADAVEVDVRNSDSGLVLSHNAPDADAVPLRRAFELLRLHPEKRLNCDLKENGLEKAVFSLAVECGVGAQLIYTGEVDPALFTKDAPALPLVSWYANISSFSFALEKDLDDMSPEERKAALLTLLDRMSAYRTAGLNWRYDQAALVLREAAARGIGISIWTVDDRQELLRWFQRDPANITTNRLKTALSLRSSSPCVE